MSLDVYLSYECCGHGVVEKHEENVFNANITHNLNKMAAKAEIYTELWRPEELGITFANELISPLKSGLERLKANPEFFKQFNASNGWGLYENFVSFVEKYLEACQKYPKSKVTVSK